METNFIFKNIKKNIINNKNKPNNPLNIIKHAIMNDSILKLLKNAISDNDNIYAIIKGSSINQDGSTLGITAPNHIAQEEVIINAWKKANIDPETISYIEAHGTGTKLGDPIEIQGIKNAFEKSTDKKQFCAIGSVKSNIGHLDCAAGIAGLIKAVLSIKNKKILPTIHFKYPNSNIWHSTMVRKTLVQYQNTKPL